MDTPVTPLTLGEAAKHTGMSKTTLSRAIKSGKLSVLSKQGNSYQIDPSELFRVFPPYRYIATDENVTMLQYTTPDVIAHDRLLQKELEHTQALLQREREANEHLQRMNSELMETVKQQTRLLTHIKDTTVSKGFLARWLSKTQSQP